MMNRIKKRNIFISIVILLISFNCAYYNTLFNAKKNYNEGIKIIQKEPEKEKHPQANKYFEQTIEKCWKLIEIYGEKSKYADDALLYIVKSEFHLQKYAQARLHVNNFLSKYPQSDYSTEALLWYGKILLKENKIDEGQEKIQRSLNISKSSKIKAEGYYELGNLAFLDEDYQKAVEYFEKALSEDIDKQYAAFIQFYLGESYFQEKSFKEAIDRYKKVEKFSPSLDVEYNTKFNLATGYSEIGNYDEALTILRKMLTAPRFNHFSPAIKSKIAAIYEKQKILEDAIDLYKEVVREKKPHAGTALASFNLGKIYEYQIQDIDSAVFYYGNVKKAYSKFDSVEVAEQKYQFLSGLKTILDELKQDKRLIYRLENDQYFMDSLYSAQYKDSILQKIQPSTPKTQNMSDTITIDTTSQLYNKDISYLDSLKLSVKDSLNITLDDSVRVILEDSLRKIDKYILNLAPKPTEEDKKLEKRKLPQIKEDYKNNRYHLAEFFLLQVQNYDSALYYYKDFLNTFQDSILTPKALYSMSFIYSQPTYSDSLKKDSLEQILLEDYPNSPFSKNIKKQRGQLDQSEKPDSLNVLGHRLFLKAENLYENNMIDSAISVFRTTSDLDSNLMWSAKAQLAIASIYENDFGDIERAITEYTHLAENFSQSDYRQHAALKIAPPREEVEVDDSSAAYTDTLNQALKDSATTVAGGERDMEDRGITIQTDDSLPVIKDIEKFRRWRQSRSN